MKRYFSHSFIATAITSAVIFGLFAVPATSEALISNLLDPVNLKITTIGKIEGYAIGDKFDFNKMKGGLQVLIQNDSQSVAKDVTVYWELRSDESIGGKGDGNIVCRDQFSQGYMFQGNAVKYPATAAECPAFLSGGLYHLNVNARSKSADIYNGKEISNWATSYFEVTPMPKFDKLAVIGVPTVQRHNLIMVDNPTPKSADFFVGDEMSFIRDVSFQKSVPLTTGFYKGGIYNASGAKMEGLVVFYRLYDGGMNLICERSSGRLSLEREELLYDWNEQGYKAAALYQNCAPFGTAGRYTVEVQAATLAGLKAIAKTSFVVGTTQSVIINHSVPAPQAPIVVVVPDPAIAIVEAQNRAESVSTVVALPNHCAAILDTDGDMLSDTDEVQAYGTNPYAVDTDGDGFNDGLEAHGGFNPTGSGKFYFGPTDSLRCVAQRLAI